MELGENHVQSAVTGRGVGRLEEGWGPQPEEPSGEACMS